MEEVEEAAEETKDIVKGWWRVWSVAVAVHDQAFETENNIASFIKLSRIPRTSFYRATPSPEARAGSKAAITPGGPESGAKYKHHYYNP